MIAVSVDGNGELRVSLIKRIPPPPAPSSPLSMCVRKGVIGVGGEVESREPINKKRSTLHK